MRGAYLGLPAIVIRNERRSRSRGFGATTLAMRRALAIEGPWTGPHDAMTPPESTRDNAFVYAGKGHPNLIAGAGFDLVVTYADNSFTFADLFDPANAQTLYWPHFARIQFVYVQC